MSRRSAPLSFDAGFRVIVIQSVTLIQPWIIDAIDTGDFLANTACLGH